MKVVTFSLPTGEKDVTSLNFEVTDPKGSLVQTCLFGTIPLLPQAICSQPIRLLASKRVVGLRLKGLLVRLPKRNVQVINSIFSQDPFAKKDWYDVKAPSMFNIRQIGKTLVTRTQGTSKIIMID